MSITWPFGRRRLKVVGPPEDPPPATPAGADVLTLWPPKDIQELRPPGTPAGKSIAMGTLRYHGGAELGLLVLTCFRSEPEGVQAVPLDGRWFTLEIL